MEVRQVPSRIVIGALSGGGGTSNLKDAPWNMKMGSGQSSKLRELLNFLFVFMCHSYVTEI